MPPEQQIPVVETETKEQAQAPTPAVAQKTETPAEHMIPKSRFDEVSRKLRELEAEAVKKDKALQEEDERRQAEQGEWKKLAEERKTQLEQLAPKGELADRLSEMVAKQLDTEIAAWPDSVRAIMPKEDGSLLERLEWAERTRPLAQELIAAKGPNGTPYPAQHAGTGGNKPVTTKEQAQNTLNKAYAPRKPAT